MKPLISVDEVKAYQGRGKYGSFPVKFAKRLCTSYLVIAAENEALRTRLAELDPTYLAEQRDDLYAQADSAMSEVYDWQEKCRDLETELMEARRMMTNLQKLVVAWRYWDVMTQAATSDEWAEFHNEFLAAERNLKDEADRLRAKEKEAR